VNETAKIRFPVRLQLCGLLVLAAWACALGGCSSNLNGFGDQTTTGGTSIISEARGEAPKTPPPPFPAVHDMPPPRDSTILTDYEQKKLENDLIAARRRVAPEADKPKPKSDKTKSDKDKLAKTKPDGAKPAAPQKTGNKQDP
jgi:outer membrane biosynthesis protein TonB